MSMPSVSSLWSAALEPVSPATYGPEAVAGLPEPVQRYFDHALKPGAPIARRAKLGMRGKLKADDGWKPFKAQEVVDPQLGYVWEVKLGPWPGLVRGADYYVGGVGGQDFRKLFGGQILHSDGQDVSRSGAARAAIESVLAPSALLPCCSNVAWSAVSNETIAAHWVLGSLIIELILNIAPDGALKSARLMRWGNPDGGAFGWHSFGLLADNEKTFGPVTIPSRLRAGWDLGGDLLGNGIMFEAEITGAEYR